MIQFCKQPDLGRCIRLMPQVTIKGPTWKICILNLPLAPIQPPLFVAPMQAVVLQEQFLGQARERLLLELKERGLKGNFQL